MGLLSPERGEAGPQVLLDLLWLWHCWQRGGGPLELGLETCPVQTSLGILSHEQHRTKADNGRPTHRR